MPEIHRVDLAGTLLSLHAWGHSRPSRFGWFESPSPERLAAAERVLEMLGAVEGGTITEMGRRILDIPASPRLARLLIEANDRGMLRQGATLAALLSERDIVRRGHRQESHGASDVLVRLDRFAEAEAGRFHAGLRDRGIDPAGARRVAQARDDLLRITRRWNQMMALNVEEHEDILLRLLLIAFPDRVCRRRKSDAATAMMVGGRAVRLAAESVVRGGDLFLALDPREDDRGSSREASVRIASRIELEWLDELFGGEIHREQSAPIR